MNAPSSLTKTLIRDRDGDACWLCTLPMDFSAVPNSKMAPTIEHVEAKSLGGTNGLDNLALCHQKCNAHLKDRPLAKKLEMRGKWHANAAKAAEAKSASPAKISHHKLPQNAVSASPAKSEPLPCPVAPSSTSVEIHPEIAYWRRLALISGGGLLVTAGFAAGVGAMMLIY